MGISAQPGSVLILDDSPAFTAAAADFVERLAGFAPVAAEVVLIDLGHGGLEIAQRIKRGGAGRVVIGLALFPTPELVAHALRLGVDAVVSKEGFSEELPGALRRLGLSR